MASVPAGAQHGVRPLLAVGGVTLLVVVTATGYGWAFDERPRWPLISDTLLGCCFALAGLAAWRVRPGSRTGPLMALLGISMLAANPFGFELGAGAPGGGWVRIVAEPVYWLQFGVAAQLLLSYPSGRLTRGALSWWVARACQTLVLVMTVVVAAEVSGADPAAVTRVRAVVAAGWTVLAGLALVALAMRVRRGPPRRRREEGFAMAAAAVALLMFAALFLESLAAGRPGAYDSAGDLHTGMAWTGVIAVPVAFFAGLLRRRLAFASAGALTQRLVQVGPGEVERTLGAALHDPGLRVAFPARASSPTPVVAGPMPVVAGPTPAAASRPKPVVAGPTGPTAGRPATAAGPGSDESWLDVHGAAFRPPDDPRRITPIGSPPWAVLVHDPALHDDRPLLAAVTAAAALALENARLQAELQAQLSAVQASRRRIAVAVDATRRRLERDLHQGTGQRLREIGDGLARLSGRLDCPAAAALAGELRRDVADAIADLRDLAHGVRPAVLTENGLAAAVDALCARAAGPVNLMVSVGPELDPLTESTAYFVVSEALQNVAKHAPSATAKIIVLDDGGVLQVWVGDDGPGGATGTAGSGLSGLADRVAAAGGSFEVTSPPGFGTTVTAVLPARPRVYTSWFSAMDSGPSLAPA